MKPLKGAEIRQMYLDFFKEKGHSIEPSASLVPVDDPSLLWINSGVATLKKYFDGRVVPNNPRITNAQKSIRTNDIENVGKTARHHTFFEMLGNFSIGDYFKEEAITWAWEFLTSPKWIGFDPEKLSVTIHPEDEEAFNYWNEKIGLPKERIIRLEENFWDIGEGPSGPNTEIFYDRGESYGNDPNDPELYPGGENERYLEVWNLVFSQFNHNPDGTYTPLPKKNIDTGMGLERMASITQNVPTNFDTDLFMTIIGATEALCDVKYRTDAATDVAFKVIADHIRTVSFAVCDGALPSNEGRGYVLRRLLRRAVRYAKMLGIERPFMYQLVPVVGGIMEDYYPEVLAKKEHIARVIKSEEERFHETLNEGLAKLQAIFETMRTEQRTQMAGEDVFRLYDTYGFPVELTEEYAEEQGLSIDRAGFESAMEQQRERARNARQDVDSMQVQSEVLRELTAPSAFVGYFDASAVETKVIALVHEGALVKTISEGQEAQLMLSETPFYAESGGQTADRGTIASAGATVEVLDVSKAPNGQHLHRVRVVSGELSEGDAVTAEIRTTARASIVKNHTATHLLHRALKDLLGEHVNQAGSLVTDERLRFDFSHYGAVTAEELVHIERAVNEQIWAQTPVVIEEMDIDAAKARGAMALFGEKYGKTVRVVAAGDYSVELCGGCHVNNTAEIGLFKIVAESGIGAGTRRIEAVTGRGAYELLAASEQTVKRIAAGLKTPVKDVETRVDALDAELRASAKEIESLRAKLSNIESASLLDKVEKINNVNVLAAEV
ncbi:MAG: alanine--tRNA ligase, partial [Bacilli bacterium]